MKPLNIVGTKSQHVILEQLVERLEKEGSVGLLTSTDGEIYQGKINQDSNPVSDATTDTTYYLSDSGTWFATGSEERTVSDLLDEMAPAHEYVILDGFPDVDVPTVALGNADHVGPALASASTPSQLDIERLAGKVDETEPYETLESLVARVKRSPASKYAGALATFTGRVRTKEDENDPPTEHLEFEKYDGVAEERMQTISEELCKRDGVHEVLLHHRTGVIEAEEDIVFVVVLAGHRSEAFRTVSDGIDRLKDEVPLFKKEVTVEDEYWRHEVTGE